jgi:gag-polypeptide of LTR copia-type
VKDARDVLKWFYEGRRWNRKFMDKYLRTGREKMSELARIGTKLDIYVKLAILVNGLPESYRYLVVALELKEMDDIDFDETTARLVEEEQRLGKDSASVRMAFTARWKDIVCFGCGQ